MKAVIGQYYKTAKQAAKRVKELKNMWKGRVAYVVVGSEQSGFLVVGEGQARACDNEVSFKERKYNEIQRKEKMRIIESF